MQKRKFLPSATCVYGETKEIQHTSHNEISEPKPLVIRSDNSDLLIRSRLLD